jgi:hypothetical protein
LPRKSDFSLSKQVFFGLPIFLNVRRSAYSHGPDFTQTTIFYPANQVAKMGKSAPIKPALIAVSRGFTPIRGIHPIFDV